MRLEHIAVGDVPGERACCEAKSDDRGTASTCARATLGFADHLRVSSASGCVRLRSDREEVTCSLPLRSEPSRPDVKDLDSSVGTAHRSAVAGRLRVAVRVQILASVSIADNSLSILKGPVSSRIREP